MAALRSARNQLKDAIDKWVLTKKNYEDDGFKLTRVVGHRRHWDTAKLERILPRGIFKNIVRVEADSAKIDQYVRAGRLSLDLIEPALIEEPTAPYVKWTTKRVDANPDEAEKLREQFA